MLFFACVAEVTKLKELSWKKKEEKKIKPEIVQLGGVGFPSDKTKNEFVPLFKQITKVIYNVTFL